LHPCLVCQLAATFAKAHIDNCTRQTAIAYHAMDIQILKADYAIASRDPRGELVQRITADIGDFSM
jgi:hypothetical protein